MSWLDSLTVSSGTGYDFDKGNFSTFYDDESEEDTHSLGHAVELSSESFALLKKSLELKALSIASNDLSSALVKELFTYQQSFANFITNRSVSFTAIGSNAAVKKVFFKHAEEVEDDFFSADSVELSSWHVFPGSLTDMPRLLSESKMSPSEFPSFYSDKYKETYKNHNFLIKILSAIFCANQGLSDETLLTSEMITEYIFDPNANDGCLELSEEELAFGQIYPITLWVMKEFHPLNCIKMCWGSNVIQGAMIEAGPLTFVNNTALNYGYSATNLAQYFNTEIQGKMASPAKTEYLKLAWRYHEVHLGLAKIADQIRKTITELERDHLKHLVEQSKAAIPVVVEYNNEFSW